MMTLGDKLGADDNVEMPSGDAGQFLAHALDGGDEIAGEHKEPRLRKQFAHLLFQPFDAGPDRNERIGCPTLWTCRRMRHCKAAQVADASTTGMPAVWPRTTAMSRAW